MHLNIYLLCVLYMLQKFVPMDVLLVALLDVLFGVSLVDVPLDVVQFALLEVLLDVALVALLDVLFDPQTTFFNFFFSLGSWGRGCMLQKRQN